MALTTTKLTMLRHQLLLWTQAKLLTRLELTMTSRTQTRRGRRSRPASLVLRCSTPKELPIVPGRSEVKRKTFNFVLLLCYSSFLLILRHIALSLVNDTIMSIFVVVFQIISFVLICYCFISIFVLQTCPLKVPCLML